MSDQKSPLRKVYNWQAKKRSLYSPSFISTNQILIFAIVLIGIFLRIYNLGSDSIWVDEAFSLRDAGQPTIEILTGYNRPLYYILLRYWIEIFGSSDVSIRLLSVIFGVATIIFLYKLGVLLFDDRTGIIAALLLSLSLFHINYSQEARMYTLLTAFTAISMIYFIKYIRNQNTFDFAGYLATSLLLLLTHPYGIFIVFTQSVYVFTKYLDSNSEIRSIIKYWISGQTILGILYLPFIIPPLMGSGGPGHLSPPDITEVPYLIARTIYIQLEVGRGFSIMDSFSLHTLFVIIFLLISLFTFAHQYLESNLESKLFRIFLAVYRDDSYYLVLLWITIPVILPIITSIIITPIFGPARYTIAVSLGLFILIAYGISNIRSEYIRRGLILTIIVGSLIGMPGYYAETSQQEWETVASCVDGNAEPGELIVFNTGFTQLPFDHYSSKEGLEKQPFPEYTDAYTAPDVSYTYPRSERYIDQNNVGLLVEWAGQYPGIWIVISHSDERPDGLVEQEVGQVEPLVFHKEYSGIELYYFSSNRENEFNRSVC